MDLNYEPECWKCRDSGFSGDPDSKGFDYCDCNSGNWMWRVERIYPLLHALEKLGFDV